MSTLKSRIVGLIAVVTSAVIATGSPALGTARSGPSPVVNVPIPSTGHLGLLDRVGGFGAMVIDPILRQVWVSQPQANSLAVFDYFGIRLRTVSNQTSASSMVIHGRDLYVALPGAGRIERIDFDTGRDMGAVVTGLSSPRALAYVGGRVWTNTYLSPRDVLTSVDPSTGGVHTYSTFGYDGLTLAASAPNANVLVAASSAVSPATIQTIDVSSSAPRLLATIAQPDTGQVRDLAVTPDGTRVVPATGCPYAFEELTTSTLTDDGVVYGGDVYPSAVAIGGSLIATGTSDGYTRPDIRVYRLGSSKPIFSADTAPALGVSDVLSRGLALSPDGSLLFAVTDGDWDYRKFSLHVFRIRQPWYLLPLRISCQSCVPGLPIPALRRAQ
jgi:hypothetical protein